MAESRTASALTKIGVLYLVALVGVVGGLIVSPFSVPLLMALLALIIVFFSFTFVTICVASLLIAANVIDLLVPGFKAYLNSRLRSARLNRLAMRDDDAAGLTLSAAKLKRLSPELFAQKKGVSERIADRFGGKAALRYLIIDQLWNGDRRAAVVVSLDPLLVAAYADKLDAVVLLRFPQSFVAEYGLTLFGRLVAVNRYFQDRAVAEDIEPGQLAVKGCTNFRPVIAEFLCDEAELVRGLRVSIREDEWRRATFLGRQYHEKNPTRVRDGRPLRSAFPAAANLRVASDPDSP